MQQPSRIPRGDAAALAAALDENEVARVIGVQVKTFAQLARARGWPPLRPHGTKARSLSAV